MLEQISSVFLDEASELLENLEEQLLTLESNPTDMETIGAVFRAMHTIKGSSAMFGFNAVSEFTHEVESAMDQVRNGIVPVTNELIDLMLKARDHIRDMLDAGSDITQEINQTSQSLIQSFKEFVNKNGGATPEDIINEAASAPPPESINTQKNESAPSTYRIKFRPSKTVLQNGTRPELLVKELTELGTATVVAFYDGLPPLSQIDSELCYFSWDIMLTTEKTENDINDVFIFLDSDSTINIEKVELNPDANYRIGDILVDRNEVSQKQIESVISEHKQLGQILVEKQMVSQQQIKSALAEQQHLKSLNDGGQPSSAATQTSIRVSSEKLDTLVDLIGELVTFNARLEQVAIEKNIPILKNLSEQCGRLAVSLRDTSMEIRMLPIGTLFTRFRRTVRDLAEQLGKEIELVIEGAETELDKTVIEKLNDPLLHLIRNSVDHGIELPLERVAKGKNGRGTVTLSAKHQGGVVIITISDDGKGLDKKAIRIKGIEKGLINENDELTESEIFHLIFQPGFSTAKQVSNISGRGVGLDVVKKDVLSLGGSVSIESKPDQGTSFILKIPLTLAIIDGMLTQIGGTKYIIPLNSISECLFYAKPAKKTSDPMFPATEVHGKDIPCIDLRKFFKIPEPHNPKMEVVAINTQDGTIGIIVDKILGNHQTVIKPLGKLYQNCLGIGNATILGDGSVALILDVYKLADLVIDNEKGKN